MFEKIVPVIIALIALQLLVKYMNKRKKNRTAPAKHSDYKKKIDEFMKIGDYDHDINNEKLLAGEIHSKLRYSDLMREIPESMSDVGRGLTLILDGVTHAVKGKIGSKQGVDNKYNSPEKMFDEILEVISRHRI